MATSDRNDSEDLLMQAYLRQVAPLPAYSAEEWARLGQRILRAAQPLFATRTPRAVWREDLVSLARIAIPMALAAGVAALVLLDRVEASASKEAVPVSAFLSAMVGETSRETVLDLTLGQNSQRLLLADGR